VSALSERYTQILVEELRTGRNLDDALRDLTLAHAQHLRELGPVRVLALDPCPICMGQVIATEVEARCTSCNWRYVP
jgi:hypothetical protein